VSGKPSGKVSSESWSIAGQSAARNPHVLDELREALKRFHSTTGYEMFVDTACDTFAAEHPGLIDLDRPEAWPMCGEWNCPAKRYSEFFGQDSCVLTGRPILGGKPCIHVREACNE